MEEIIVDGVSGSEEQFIYVLVGNIIDKNYFGESKNIRSGIKRFSAGTKVYMFPEYGGMGHEVMPVLGLARKSKRRIKVVIRTETIKNIRVKKIFNIKLIHRIKNEFSGSYFFDHEPGLKGFAEVFNERYLMGSKEIVE